MNGMLTEVRITVMICMHVSLVGNERQDFVLISRGQRQSAKTLQECSILDLQTKDERSVGKRNESDDDSLRLSGIWIGGGRHE